MNYFLYILRELTGPLIVFYLIAFLIGAIFDPHLAFTSAMYFKIISWIGFAAAVIHTLTWLAVLPKLLFDSRTAQIILYVALLASVGAISYLILPILYV